MIENKIQLLDRNSINTHREYRFRARLDSDHITMLAKQIQDHGLIHAILVDRDTNDLIAGENRFAAFERLQTIGAPCKFDAYKGWTCIPVRYAKDVTLLERRVMELSENVGSAPMTWQDIAKGLLEVQQLMHETDEEITQGELGRRLGMSDSVIAKYLMVARSLDDPEIAAYTSINTAANVLRRKQDRKLDSLVDDLNWTNPNVGTEETNEELVLEEVEDGETGNRSLPAARRIQPVIPEPAKAKPSPEPAADFRGIAESFLEWAPNYSGPKFNLVHFDPPYGINLHKSATMRKSGRAQYEDTEDLFHAILGCLLAEQDRLLSRSAHILFWHSADDRAMVQEELTAAGWRVWQYPLIWHKSCNTGLFPDSTRGPRHTYEMATLASRGDRKIVRLVADSFSGAARKDSGHESEKPVEMLEHFFTMLVDESSKVLDPTGGSGNAIRAAKNKGAAGGLFLELEEHYVNVFNSEMRGA